MSETNFEEMLDQYGRVEFECGHEDDGSRVTARKWRASILAHVAGLQRENERLIAELQKNLDALHVGEQICQGAADRIESLQRENERLKRTISQAQIVHNEEVALCVEREKRLEQQLSQAKQREKVLIEACEAVIEGYFSLDDDLGHAAHYCDGDSIERLKAALGRKEG